MATRPPTNPCLYDLCGGIGHYRDSAGHLRLCPCTDPAMWPCRYCHEPADTTDRERVHVDTTGDGWAAHTGCIEADRDEAADVVRRAAGEER